MTESNPKNQNLIQGIEISALDNLFRVMRQNHVYSANILGVSVTFGPPQVQPSEMTDEEALEEQNKDLYHSAVGV